MIHFGSSFNLCHRDTHVGRTIVLVFFLLRLEKLERRVARREGGGTHANASESHTSGKASVSVSLQLLRSCT